LIKPSYLVLFVVFFDYYRKIKTKNKKAINNISNKGY